MLLLIGSKKNCIGPVFFLPRHSGKGLRCRSIQAGITAITEELKMIKKLIASSVMATLVLALAGCDATTRSAPGNTTLGAAAAGGLGGAAIGAATGHGTKGALIGAGVGTLGGAVVGQQMERNRDRAIMQQQQVQGAYDAGYRDAGAPPPPPPPPPRTY